MHSKNPKPSPDSESKAVPSRPATLHDADAI